MKREREREGDRDRERESNVCTRASKRGENDIAYQIQRCYAIQNKNTTSSNTFPESNARSFPTVAVEEMPTGSPL